VLSEVATSASTKTLGWPEVAALIKHPGEFQSFEVLGIRLEYGATSDVGNRTLELRLTDGAESPDILLEHDLGETVAADGDVALDLRIEPNGTEDGSNRTIPAGFRVFNGIDLVIGDTAGIEATDDCVVHVYGLLRS